MSDDKQTLKGLFYLIDKYMLIEAAAKSGVEVAESTLYSWTLFSDEQFKEVAKALPILAKLGFGLADHWEVIAQEEKWGLRISVKQLRELVERKTPGAEAAYFMLEVSGVLDIIEGRGGECPPEMTPKAD